MPESEHSVLARIGRHLRFIKEPTPPPHGSLQSVFISRGALSPAERARQEYTARHSPEERARVQFAIMEAAFTGYALASRRTEGKGNMLGLLHDMAMVGMDSPHLIKLYKTPYSKKVHHPVSLTRKNIRDSRLIGSRMARLGMSPAASLHIIEQLAVNPTAIASMSNIYREARSISDINVAVTQRRHGLPQPASRR